MKVKEVLKKVIPPKWVRQYRLMRSESRIQRILDASTEAADGSFLDGEELDRLMSEYGYPAPYGYGADELLQRGEVRAAELLGFTRLAPGSVALEVGCGDGMVSNSLLKRGFRSLAVDQSERGFDTRAVTSGVEFIVSSGKLLPLETGSVDLAFSYNAFEHIGHPQAAAEEMLRVVRPGGTVFLSFGPLYNSPFGEHAYRSIPIPYCQILFGLEQLNVYCEANGLRRIDPDHVNRWSLSQYRELWSGLKTGARIAHYHEGGALSHIRLVERHAPRFKRVSSWAREFLVSEISIVLTKQPNA